MNEEERFLITYRRNGDRRPVAEINNELMTKLNQVTVEPVSEPGTRYTGRYHRPVEHRRPRVVELTDPADECEVDDFPPVVGPHDVCPWCQRIWAKHPEVPNDACLFPRPLPGDPAGTAKTARVMAGLITAHGTAYSQAASENAREASA